jgi:hypothetical protein
MKKARMETAWKKEGGRRLGRGQAREAAWTRRA